MAEQPTLPRGPHRLSPEQVTASQRRRILDALTALVGKRGYAVVTIADIVRRARVSKSAFYAHFSGKEHAFITAMSDFARRAHREVVEAAQSADSALEATRCGNRRIARIGREHHLDTRCLFAELTNAGPSGVALLEQLRREWEVTFEALAARFRVEDPTLPPLSAHASYYVTAGTFTLVAEAASDDSAERRRRALEAIFELWIMTATGRTTTDMTLPDDPVYHQTPPGS